MSHWRDAFCLTKTDTDSDHAIRSGRQKYYQFGQNKTQTCRDSLSSSFLCPDRPLPVSGFSNMTGPLATTATSDYSWQHWMADQLIILLILVSSPVPLPEISSYLSSSSRRAICFTFLLHAAEVFLPCIAVASLNHRVVWDAIGSNKKMTHPRELTAAREQSKLFPVTVSTRSPHTAISAWPAYLWTLISGARFPLPHNIPVKCMNAIPVPIHQTTASSPRGYINRQEVWQVCENCSHDPRSERSDTRRSFIVDNVTVLLGHEGSGSHGRQTTTRRTGKRIIWLMAANAKERVSIAFKFKSNNLTPPPFFLNSTPLHSSPLHPQGNNW